ncbi:FHF complex subunit HOOK interacting protein 2A-like [Ylistrum balloti]|uniref:FHF complex subunit HOOK interacting protein 2A-like n=1 Tax=Ylistrum balloti TaxID=509963 RepID=UPI002905D942|nr:FHF complex subunit HOOK interacting protein 2A-like [Ylistrum balloti]
MKKRMFSKFTNYLHQAVEALAPQIPLQEEFVYHWKSVTGYFMDNRGDKLPVDQTNIPVHLDQMVILLQQEESVSDRNSTGPCMEYLLQHKLLETLYSLGRTDHPPGMKQAVLTFFTKLLSRLEQPLLPHVNVHRAVHRLVKACGEVKAAPSESEEIQFLCTVCAKIKEDPYLVNFFIDIPKKKILPGAAKPVTTLPSEESQQSAGVSQQQSDDQTPTGTTNTLKEFSLVSSLIILSHSADSRVAVKACEGLMLCASLPEPAAAKCIIEDTSFCTELSQRLVESYLKLPSLVNPVDLENVEAKWGLDVITESEDHQTFLGKRHLVSFLSWLDYCDQLIGLSNPSVGTALAKSIRNLFLDVIMEPSILQTSESGAVLATAYLTRCLRTVCSPQLLLEFSKFILGDNREPEVVDIAEGAVRDRLIQRCNHISDELCLVTLKLFDTLLQKEEEHIIHNLVLRNVIGRKYYKEEEPEVKEEESGGATENVSQATDPAPSSETIAEGSVPDSATEAKPSVNGLERSQSVDSTGTSGESSLSFGSSPTTSPSRGKSEVHKIVNSFLSLLPEELKSSYQTADSGYDMYLRDAHKQFKDVSGMCSGWTWPTEAVPTGDKSESAFYEGGFLKMLLDKLSHMLNQSYSMNLQVTLLVSKLAMLPHPHLSEYLLEPNLPVKDGARTLFSILTKIASEINVKLGNDPGLSQKLVVARKQLMGMSPNIHRLEDHGQLEAIIVLEEFCKELSAIAFVKHHAAVTRT